MASYTDILAHEIHAAGWTWGETGYVDAELGKRMIAVDAHNPGRRRCIVRACTRREWDAPAAKAYPLGVADPPATPGVYLLADDRWFAARPDGNPS